jgi:hypothetical protein
VLTASWGGNADAKLREAVKHLDMAIIMGGPAELVQAFLEQVEPAIVATSRAAAPADEVPAADLTKKCNT